MDQIVELLESQVLFAGEEQQIVAIFQRRLDSDRQAAEHGGGAGTPLLNDDGQAGQHVARPARQGDRLRPHAERAGDRQAGRYLKAGEIGAKVARIVEILNDEKLPPQQKEAAAGQIVGELVATAFDLLGNKAAEKDAATRRPRRRRPRRPRARRRRRPSPRRLRPRPPATRSISTSTWWSPPPPRQARPRRGPSRQRTPSPTCGPSPVEWGEIRPQADARFRQREAEFWEYAHKMNALQSRPENQEGTYGTNQAVIGAGGVTSTALGGEGGGALAWSSGELIAHSATNCRLGR